MTVRELKVTDFRDLVANYYEFYNEVTENPNVGITLFLSKPSWADELAWFSDLFRGVEEGKEAAMVAEENGHVVGLCEVRAIQRNHEVSHRGDLGISVKRGFRGRGIGAELMKRTIDSCKGKFEIIELSVFSTNEVAKAMYRKFGFKTIGVRPRAVKRRDKYIDEELMYLQL